MAIQNLLERRSGDRVANLQTYKHTIAFDGDNAYPDGGWPGVKALFQSLVGFAIKPIAVMAINCGAYLTQLTESPASVQTAPASWPVADQDTNTILYKLNGADEATLTFAITTTTAAHVAAAVNAIAGVHAYVDGDSEVTIKTDKVGEDASFEITGGTAIDALGLAVGESVGNDDLLLRVNNVADGTDAGANDPSTDLSAVHFEVLVISE